MSANKREDEWIKSAPRLNELDDGTASRAAPKGGPKGVSSSRASGGGLFGMRPGQAFIVSAMLLVFVCLAGFAVLVIMGKMALPL